MAFPIEGQAVAKRVRSNNSIVSASDSGGTRSANDPSPPWQPRQSAAQGSRIQYQEQVTFKQTATHSRFFEEEADSFGFMPVREGSSSRKRAATRGEQSSSRVVGKPITEDPDLVGLTPYQLDLLDRFLSEAKRLREKIMEQRKWDRIESVFTDRILRTIGLRLPMSKLTFIPSNSFLRITVTNFIIKTGGKELMAIPGVSADKVESFGKRFIDLCKKYKQELEENMEGVDMSQIQHSQYIAADEDEDENYINSDDDDDDEADYDENGERSEYFQPPGMSQAQLALLGQVAGAAKVSGGGGSSSKAAAGGRVKKGYGGGAKRGTKRGGGSGGARRQSGGGKRFSVGSATSQGASRGGRSGGGGRNARGGGGRSQGGGSTSIIRPMT